MKMRTVLAGLVGFGVAAGLALGQAGAKAGSSAALHPSEQRSLAGDPGLRNDNQKTGDGSQKDAAKRAMTFADLMAMKRVSDPQISPSGKWVMFSVMDVSLEKNTKVNHLWVVALGGGGSTDRKSTRLNSS